MKSAAIPCGWRGCHQRFAYRSHEAAHDAMVTHVAIEHLHIAPSAWATAVFTAHCPGCRGHNQEENR